MGKQKRYWLAAVPDKCELCQAEIGDAFVDGRLLFNHLWAIMCLTCHANHGGQTGVGIGQLYQREPGTEKFVKRGG